MWTWCKHISVGKQKDQSTSQELSIGDTHRIMHEADHATFYQSKRKWFSFCKPVRIGVWIPELKTSGLFFLLRLDFFVHSINSEGATRLVCWQRFDELRVLGPGDRVHRRIQHMHTPRLASFNRYTLQLDTLRFQDGLSIPVLKNRATCRKNSQREIVVPKKRISRGLKLK
jgi:hypothetical protein